MTPFVVIPMDLRPSERSSFRRPEQFLAEIQRYDTDDLRMILSKPLRTVGSPPVKRILVTPLLTKRVANRMISSSVKIWAAGDRCTPSLGMQ